jgi:hypothetical protein
MPSKDQTELKISHLGELSGIEKVNGVGQIDAVRR